MATSSSLSSPVHSGLSCQRWQKPLVGTFKINVNGTCLHSPASIAIGVLVRDSAGSVMAGEALLIVATRSVGVVKAMALSRGIRLAVDLGLSSVVIESDSMSVVQQLQNHVNDRSTIRFYLLEARQLLDAHPHISCHFIRREANGVAHALSNYAASSITSISFSSTSSSNNNKEASPTPVLESALKRPKPTESNAEANLFASVKWNLKWVLLFGSRGLPKQEPEGPTFWTFKAVMANDFLTEDSFVIWEKKDYRGKEKKDVITKNMIGDEEDTKRFLKSKREALISCLEIAAWRYKTPWCQTVIDSSVKHAFDNVARFTSRQWNAIEKLWAFVWEQQIRRKQGKSVSGNMMWTILNDFSIRHSVGASEDRRCQQWLG
ncbi:Detected protein of unknown function [Hibiscus syriacus]|uniref:RNase H type-1 domain-containing protein n=1 Tax=Hibiscus syriacus TaxID=106335 RepID=A0A6A2XCK8_HIBSY|nr:Detected protein of unknown function [Hibiscus syriacus]